MAIFLWRWTIEISMENFSTWGHTDKTIVKSLGDVVRQQKDNMIGYEDVETLGCCNARPYTWVTALVVCNFFNF